MLFRTSLLALATVSACTDGASTSTAEQEAINPELPGNLNPTLHAKTTVTIGAFTDVFGDVASTGLAGSVVFDVSSSQGFNRHTIASTIRIRAGASVGHLLGNDLVVDGFAQSQRLGLDPGALPPVPAVTTATPGTTNVSVAINQARQLCAGQYGAISLAAHSTLNLNGGVYHLSRLTLGEGAKLQPSEPVVLLIAGNVVTGTGATIGPSPQAINAMVAGDIRIEAGGSFTLGENNQVRAHLLVPNGKLATGKNTALTGAVWAKTIALGTQGFVIGEGVFSAQAPSVPPPCNDNNACTVDQCVGSGAAVAFCRNTPVPTGTSCEDDNTCNGVELCDAAGQCAAGAPPSAGTSCADDTVCNGDETCDGISTCVAGAPPVVSDGNACTGDACDPIAGVSHEPVPDGTRCAGTGVCEAGTCSVAGTVFSEDFVQFQSAPAQCDRWNDFLLNQLVDGSYASVTMTGTFDPVGVTCSDPAAATQICGALHARGFASVFCDGRVWNVGECGGTEISVDSGVCFCNFSGRTVRPCTGDSWGGMNTDTCGGPSQNLTVVCE